MADSLAYMYQFIYNTMYNPQVLFDEFQEMQRNIDKVLNMDIFRTIYSVICIFSLALLTATFLASMLDKYSAGDFSVEVLFRTGLKFYVPFFALWFSRDIMENIMNAGLETMKRMKGSIITQGMDYKVNRSLLTYGIDTLGDGATAISGSSILTKWSWLAMGILPFLICCFFAIVISFMSASRILELTLRLVLSPLVYADSMFGQIDRSRTVSFLKKTFSLSFQLVVILGIWFVFMYMEAAMYETSQSPASVNEQTQELTIMSPAKALSESKETITKRVEVTDGPVVDSQYRTNIKIKERTINRYSPTAISDFIDQLTNSGHYWESLAFMLCMTLLVVKSRQISDSIFA